MSGKEQRKFARVAASVEVRFDYGEEFFTDQILNLSQGGLFVNVVKSMDLGTIIVASFRLPGFDHSFKIDGKVVRIDTEETPKGQHGMGIEFIEVAKEDERVMVQFVVQSQLTQKGF